jgi:hypothetical protein
LQLCAAASCLPSALINGKGVLKESWMIMADAIWMASRVRTFAILTSSSALLKIGGTTSTNCQYERAILGEPGNDGIVI